jgi:hypothetical protein
MALTQATTEAIWLRFLFSEILDRQYKKLPSITSMADNQECIALAHILEYHACTKHIDIQHHFIWEKVAGREVSLEYTATGVLVQTILQRLCLQRNLCSTVPVWAYISFGCVFYLVCCVVVDFTR